MKGINAVGTAAEMVYYEALRDRTLKIFNDDAVAAPLLAPERNSIAASPWHHQTSIRQGNPLGPNPFR
tara:strand:- start:1331 stop:1534 length:204 start_codon:yes stop_codon:yes gene_type:complete